MIKTPYRILSGIETRGIPLCKNELTKMVIKRQSDLKRVQADLENFKYALEVIEKRRFKEGQWVKHARYGSGIVVQFHAELHCTVKFKRSKRFLSYRVAEIELTDAPMAGTLFE